MNLYKILDFIGEKYPRYKSENTDNFLILNDGKLAYTRLSKDGDRIDGLRPFTGYLNEDNVSDLDDTDAYFEPKGLVRKYDNGFLQSKTHYNEEGQANGYCENYTLQGNIKSRGNYKNGLMDGVWEHYRIDGPLRSVGNFKNNKQNGYFKFYHENGKLELEGTYVEDREEGKWITYNKNGSVIEIREMKNDMLNGLSVEYYENGNKKSESYFVNNKREGEYKFYDENGKLTYKINFSLTD